MLQVRRRGSRLLVPTSLATPALADEYPVCLGERDDERAARLEDGDREAAAVHARLHCRQVQLPARDPRRDADPDNWVPIPQPTKPLEMYRRWPLGETE